MIVSWEQVAHEFASDGTLRDIYVRPTDRADWSAMLAMLRDGDSPCTLWQRGEPVPLSVDADALFAQRVDASMTMQVNVAGIELTCHFFTPDEIEWSLRPAQIDSAARFESLLAFLRTLATTLRKPVWLTREDRPEEPILIVDPHTDSVQ